jgi:hypothetical protein
MYVNELQKIVNKFPEMELAYILKQGTLLRLPHYEGRLMQARTSVKQFEVKYSTTLTTLRSEGLPDDATFEMHEDFIEWEYWSDKVQKTEEMINSMKQLLVRISTFPHHKHVGQQSNLQPSSEVCLEDVLSVLGGIII